MTIGLYTSTRYLEQKKQAIEEAIRYAASIKSRGNHFLDEPFTGHEEDFEKYQNTPMIRTIGG